MLNAIPLNAIPLNYKMNDIMHTFLLAGNKFMPEMHLRKPGFTYSACGPFTKNKERIRKFKATGHSGCIYKNELNKACCQHDMAYGDFKDLANKVFKKIKHLILLKFQVMMDIKED